MQMSPPLVSFILGYQMKQFFPLPLGGYSIKTQMQHFITSLATLKT